MEKISFMTDASWFHASQSVCCQEELFVHESAYIDEPVKLGHGTRIMHAAYVMAHSVIGSHSYIGHGVSVASGVLIGNNVQVMNHSMLNSGLIMEDEVYCGPATMFTPLKTIRGEAANISSIQPTLVKQGASIGAHSTIAAGFIIGSFAFIEAGSVIDRNIPDFALVYGNPVQFAGWRCQCQQPLKFTIADTTTCARCSRKYARQSEIRVVQLNPNKFGAPVESQETPKIETRRVGPTRFGPG